VLGSLGADIGGGVGGAGSSAMGKALGAVGRSFVSDSGSLDTDGVAGACGADEESLCTTEVGEVGGGTAGSGVEGAAASIARATLSC
jgi:hypothetical protein